MPIHEYVCNDCGQRYEQILLSKEQAIACPKCSSDRYTLQLSVFRAGKSSNGSSSGSDLTGGRDCTSTTCGCN